MIETQIAGPHIKLEDVSLQAGQQLLLESINARFKSGDWIGIVGPNGGGKSSLLKTILGLNNHSGKIELSWPEAGNGAGRIGYVPQLLPFDNSLPISVRDYLLMSLSKKPLWFDRKLPKIAEEALVSISLTAKLEQRIGDLSGGERQRLVLATALSQKPGLLVLDEPMTGLDKEGKQDSLKLLQAFKHAGGTILMVEHDSALVERYCDQRYWIEKCLKLIDNSAEQQEQKSSFNDNSCDD